MSHGMHDLATDLTCSPHCIEAAAHQPVVIEGVRYVRDDRPVSLRVTVKAATGRTRVGNKAHAVRGVDEMPRAACGTLCTAVALDHDYQTLPKMLRCEVCDRSLRAAAA